MGYSKSQLAEEGCLRIGSLPVVKEGSYIGLLCKDTEVLSKKNEKIENATRAGPLFDILERDLTT